MREIVAVLILLLVGDLVCYGAEDKEAQFIQGQVLDLKSPRNNPIGVSGVIVKAYDEQGMLIATALTDNEGRYTLQGVKPGTFLKIKHSKVNYLRDPEPFDGVVIDNRVVVYMGQRNPSLAYYKEVGEAIASRSTVEEITCSIHYSGPVPEYACISSSKIQPRLLEEEKARLVGYPSEYILSVEKNLERIDSQRDIMNNFIEQIDKSVSIQYASDVLKTPKFSYDIHFDLGGANLSEDDKKAIERGLSMISPGKDFKVSLACYAEGVGSPENRKLSMQRAEAVRAYIVQRGIAPSKIETLCGEEYLSCFGYYQLCGALRFAVTE